jgi:hypothetical protein
MCHGLADVFCYKLGFLLHGFIACTSGSVFVAECFTSSLSREAKKTEDPVVLWMTGGPGCASELAVFYENGPFKITDNLTLVWNEYGWDKVQCYFSYCLLDASEGTTQVKDEFHTQKCRNS